MKDRGTCTLLSVEIADMIRSMEGFTFALALDLNMDYYHIKLNIDTGNQNLCTIVFPLEHKKIQIQTLTHGYQDFHDPDVFQNVMSKLVQDMEYVKTNILS
jgi:HKD family nuclease